MKNNISKYEKMVGKKYGMLTVISLCGEDKNNHMKVKCKCDCGNETIKLAYMVLQGHTGSCGCNKYKPMIKASTKHGKRFTRIYRTWGNMKTRCYNKNSSFYNVYGGRDIRVCHEWKSNFISFYNWAISNGYSDDLTIDRINNNGNYEPNNCRWATNIKQANNRRNNVFVSFHGEKMTVSEISRKYGLKSSTLYGRIRRGIEIESYIKERADAKKAVI